MEYGLIGKTLGHSFSKDIHSRLAPYEYELFELSEEELGSFMKKADFKAINVTIPYKEAVIPYLDDVSEEAKSIGAVNTVVNKNGKLYGYNTDFLGMKKLIEKNNIDISDKKVLILGTGGTSRTAYAVACAMGAREIKKVSRSKKEGSIGYGEAYEKYADADVIINTTPSGMFPNTDGCPIDIDRFSNLTGVIDVVYNPLKTRLVIEAEKRGIAADGGLYMLVAQAFYACEFFLGEKKDESVTDKIYEEIRRKKENVVLIGMPGSGKTTIGKALGKKTGKVFVDLDEEITKTEGEAPAKIIEKYGEEHFRILETSAAKKAADLTGCIIATGGGTVLRTENTDALRRNGKIVFIDRKLEEIVPTADRPLSNNFELLKKRYSERIDIYLAAADIKMVPSSCGEENADRIIKLLGK